MRRIIVSLGLVAFVVAFVGCAGNHSKSVPSGERSKYLLTSEPPDALSVREARRNIKDGDEVVIVGRIGGRKDSWGSGQASFSLVDVSLPACSMIEGDTCDTPWDYCCVDPKELGGAMALVKIVDDQGEPVRTPAHELLGVKELQTVTARGKAKRDDKGNLTILATGLYVRSDN